MIIAQVMLKSSTALEAAKFMLQDEAQVVNHALEQATASGDSARKTWIAVTFSTSLKGSWSTAIVELKDILQAGLANLGAAFQNSVFQPLDGLPVALQHSMKSTRCALVIDGTSLPDVESWVPNPNPSAGSPYIITNCNRGSNVETVRARYFYTKEGNRVANVEGVLVRADVVSPSAPFVYNYASNDAALNAPASNPGYYDIQQTADCFYYGSQNSKCNVWLSMYVYMPPGIQHVNNYPLSASSVILTPLATYRDSAGSRFFEYVSDPTNPNYNPTRGSLFETRFNGILNGALTNPSATFDGNAFMTFRDAATNLSYALRLEVTVTNGWGFLKVPFKVECITSDCTSTGNGSGELGVAFTNGPALKFVTVGKGFTDLRY